MTIQTALPDNNQQTSKAKVETQRNTDKAHDIDELNDESHHMCEAVIDGSKKTYAYVKDHVTKGAKATDTAIHKYPYAGIVAGALIGIMAARIFSRSCK